MSYSSLPDGGYEADIVSISRGVGQPQEDMVVVELVEHEGRQLLVLMSPEQFQEWVDADDTDETPMDIRYVYAEEVDGSLVEVADPDVAIFLEQALQVAEGDPEVLEAVAEHIEASLGGRLPGSTTGRMAEPGADRPV